MLQFVAGGYIFFPALGFRTTTIAMIFLVYLLGLQFVTAIASNDSGEKRYYGNYARPYYGIYSYPKTRDDAIYGRQFRDYGKAYYGKNDYDNSYDYRKTSYDNKALYDYGRSYDERNPYSKLYDSYLHDKPYYDYDRSYSSISYDKPYYRNINNGKPNTEDSRFNRYGEHNRPRYTGNAYEAQYDNSGQRRPLYNLILERLHNDEYGRPLYRINKILVLRPQYGSADTTYQPKKQ